MTLTPIICFYLVLYVYIEMCIFILLLYLFYIYSFCLIFLLLHRIVSSFFKIIFGSNLDLCDTVRCGTLKRKRETSIFISARASLATHARVYRSYIASVNRRLLCFFVSFSPSASPTISIRMHTALSCAIDRRDHEKRHCPRLKAIAHEKKTIEVRENFRNRGEKKLRT